jgi:N-acetylglucosaminyldiphosphoundecaprenol N-acetyl-beta-D-mannosaminyltransferase
MPSTSEIDSDSLSALCERNVHCILGLPFDAVGMHEAESALLQAVVRRTHLFISTPNLNFLITSLADENFRNSVIHSDLSLADGMPVVWIARLLGVPVNERVAGASLFARLQKRTVFKKEEQLKVFFLGGPAGVAQAACNAVNRMENETSKGSVNAMRCVGYMFPGFGTVQDMSSPEIIQVINQSEVDFLVVSLGANKGQAWIENNRNKLNTPVVSHLGAVVNFVANTVQRAPAWMQKYGLEWIWRVKEEPMLWKRYFTDAIVLSRLLITRVFPLILIQYINRPSSGAINKTSIEVTELKNIRLFKISGSCEETNLHQIKAALATTPSRNQTIKLDLTKVTYIDSRFLGLLMLLREHQIRNGGKLIIGPISKTAYLIFKLSCTGFMLESK